MADFQIGDHVRTDPGSCGHLSHHLGDCGCAAGDMDCQVGVIERVYPGGDPDAHAYFVAFDAHEVGPHGACGTTFSAREMTRSAT